MNKRLKLHYCPIRTFFKFMSHLQLYHNQFKLLQSPYKGSWLDQTSKYLSYESLGARIIRTNLSWSFPLYLKIYCSTLLFNEFTAFYAGMLEWISHQKMARFKAAWGICLLINFTVKNQYGNKVYETLKRVILIS